MIKPILVYVAAITVTIVGTLQSALADEASLQKPSDSELMAFKVYHHTVYKEITTKQAGGPINYCIPLSFPQKARTLS